MAIDRDIHELLFVHDCVIVPGFGGFLAHYRPARLDEQRRLVHPPSKELSFNRHLVRQDGLVVDRLMRREGLDFHAANRRIEAEVEHWKQHLEHKGRVEVPLIGTFFHDAERNLQFEPDKRVNYLKDAYGLRPVAAVPAVKHVLETPMPPKLAVAAGDAKQGAPRVPAFLAAAATIAILLTAATWWAVGNNGMQGVSWGGFDLVHASEAAMYQLPKPPVQHVEASLLPVPWKAPQDMYGLHEMKIAGAGAAPVVVNLGQAPAKAEPESTAVAVAPVQARYHIIGGCFLEKENADRFAAELQAKGFAASLIDVKGGLYRVAYGSYPLRATALEALNAVRKEEAPDAWMLVK